MDEGKKDKVDNDLVRVKYLLNTKTGSISPQEVNEDEYQQGVKGKTAKLWMLNNTSQALLQGHMAAALETTDDGIYEGGVEYLSDGGADPDYWDGRPLIGHWEKDDEFTENAKAYNMSDRNSAFEWIDKHFDKKFSKCNV